MPFRIPVLFLAAGLLAAPAAAQKVTGRVLGGPPDKVQVELTTFPSFRQAVRRLQGEPEKPLATAKPRPDGSFEIAAPEPGFYVVTVRAEGFETRTFALHPLVGTTELSSFDLMPAEPDAARGAEPVRKVELEVRDSHGKAVPGALVRRARQPVPLGLTGPEGRLSLPLAEALDIVVETEDGKNASLRLAADAQGTRVVHLEAPVTVEGRVLETVSRSPVAGALVWADHSLLSLRPVQAAADGRFRLQIPRPRSRTLLQAAAPGHWLEQGENIASEEEGGPKPVTLLLSRVGGLVGQVVDAAGKAVAGAEVRAEPPGPAFGDNPDLQIWSGADGGFQIPGLVTGVTYEVTAWKEGFVPGSSSGEVAAPGKPGRPVRIVLSQGGTAFGRLEDEDGKPVAGATVEVLPILEPDTPPEDVLDGLVAAESRTDGAFELGPLVAGSYRPHTIAAGFAPAEISAFDVPAAGSRVDLGVLTLSPEAVVEGQVADPRGAPVARARIEAYPEDGPGRGTDLLALRRFEGAGSRTSDQDGRFRIGGLSAGEEIRIEIRARGYTEATVPGVEAPTTTPLRIELRPLVKLSGRVVDAAGEPVARAHVMVTEPRLSVPGMAHTDDQGRFQIEAGPGPIELAVQAEGYSPGSWRGEMPEQGEAGPIEITLERGAVLEGRVLDADGQPVANAGVSVFQGKSGSGRGTSMTSDADGRFQLRLETGPYRVMARTREGGNGTAAIEIQPGINRLDLRLEGGVEVLGSVSDAAGVPVPGAEVTLSFPDRGPSHQAVSAIDGTFRFQRVKDGAFELRAFKSGVGTAEQRLEVAGQTLQGLDLRLAAGGVITGRLLGLGPADLTGVSVQAGGVRHFEGVVHQDGTYRVRDLSPGEWTVWASLASGRKVTGKVMLEPGVPEAVLDLDLGGDLTLSGVVRIDGAPIPLAGISLYSSRTFEGAGGEAETGSDGRFRMTRLAPGTYTLRVGYRGEPNRLERQVELTADQEIAAEVVMGRVQGQVVSPAGAPVAGARVDLTGSHRGWISSGFAFTDDQGSFELRLPTGGYQATAGTEAFTGEARLQVPAGEVVQIQIPVQPASR